MTTARLTEQRYQKGVSILDALMTLYSTITYTKSNFESKDTLYNVFRDIAKHVDLEPVAEKIIQRYDREKFRVKGTKTD